MALATGIMSIKKYFPNPLSINSPEISPNLLLMAKVIVIGLLLKGYFYNLSDHFLPLIPIFDYFGSPVVFERTLQTLFLLACAGILLNFRVRFSCVVLGLVLLTVTVSSLTSYRNSVVFCGFLWCFLDKLNLYSCDRDFDVALLFRC